ncbi:MAG: P1 family peptidase [Acidobacteria bacterium]|nr:P1 family peptidase [Acidobacteriota bacterium]
MERRLAVVLLFVCAVSSQGKPRARELGVPFAGTPGPFNAITDVSGVEVGHTTLISGNGKLVVGEGPVRTGITIILPRGRSVDAPVFAATFALNGTGEMTGTAMIEEYGVLEGPIALTNSQSIGTVRDAVSAWLVREKHWELCCLLVVAETFDGDLNDIHGFHVHAEHVLAAISSASSGPVPEGNVGGGTGTSSRRVSTDFGTYTVGALVQANMGRRPQLTVAGIPVSTELPLTDQNAELRRGERDAGSIIIAVATDAPLLPHQLKRLAKRAALGLARTGAISGDSSGDLFLAFSTAAPGLVPLQSGRTQPLLSVQMLPNEQMNTLFEGVVEAVEEAIINALFAADTMVGINGVRVEALPVEQVLTLLKRHDRLNSEGKSNLTAQ